MDGANGGGGNGCRTVAAMIRDHWRRAGAASSFEACRREIEQAGLGRIREKTYRLHLAAAAGGRPEPVEDGAEDRPERAPAFEEPLVSPPELDKLSGFVKFACAVEAAGGVAKAREYLLIIEQIGRLP